METALDVSAYCSHCEEVSDYHMNLASSELLCNKCKKKFKISLWIKKGYDNGEFLKIIRSIQRKTHENVKRVNVLERKNENYV